MNLEYLFISCAFGGIWGAFYCTEQLRKQVLKLTVQVEEQGYELTLLKGQFYKFAIPKVLDGIKQRPAETSKTIKDDPNGDNIPAQKSPKKKRRSFKRN